MTEERDNDRGARNKTKTVKNQLLDSFSTGRGVIFITNTFW
jgi:hypothetical protein